MNKYNAQNTKIKVHAYKSVTPSNHCLALFIAFRQIHLLEILSQVNPFALSKDAKGKSQDRPCMEGMVSAAKMLTQLMDLGMAVVTPRNAVGGFGGLDLVVLGTSIHQPLLLES